MALKDFFKNLTQGKPKGDQYMQMMTGYSPIFSQFGQDVYASDVVQNCIDVIATECSKLKPRHIRVDTDGKQTTVHGRLNRLFRVAPNDLMTTRDFIEKTIWQLYLNYNAFIYPTYDIITKTDGTTRREYTGLYVLDPDLVEFWTDKTDKIFITLKFANNKQFDLAYTDVIHLRKKFSANEVMGGGQNGQPDNAPLLKVLDINNTVMEGLKKGIKHSLTIRGILNINTMLDNDAQQKERERFEAALASGESGLLTADLKGDYIPLDANPKLLDKETLQFLENKVLHYYGVPLPILKGDFDDEQYQAFYEKTLEPLIISLGQAFTKTLFTDRELDTGNEVVFYPDKLLFTNTKNRIAVADILGNRGALTNNKLLELFGYPPYEGGDVRYMNLNYVDVEIANDYQIKRAQSSKPISGGGDNNEQDPGLE